jgi:hypothetical protein
LLQLQFSRWPEIFNCQKFPHHSAGICVGENKTDSYENNELLGGGGGLATAAREEEEVEGSGGEKSTAQKTGPTGGRHHPTSRRLVYECPHTMRVNSRARFFVFNFLKTADRLEAKTETT